VPGKYNLVSKDAQITTPALPRVMSHDDARQLAIELLALTGTKAPSVRPARIAPTSKLAANLKASAAYHAATHPPAVAPAKAPAAAPAPKEPHGK